jgi:hypothetical protein
MKCIAAIACSSRLRDVYFTALKRAFFVLLRSLELSYLKTKPVTYLLECILRIEASSWTIFRIYIRGGAHQDRPYDNFGAYPSSN